MCICDPGEDKRGGRWIEEEGVEYALKDRYRQVNRTFRLGHGGVVVVVEVVMARRLNAKD